MMTLLYFMLISKVLFDGVVSQSGVNKAERLLNEYDDKEIR